ncbi:MAG: glycosyltransferase family 39 protein [Bacteroidetes bacterium]|nr:glycosyltransferase family 39 protein [Bacteroidota bacterium]MBS1929730.1 glycosyltransferase family 39 protein [Bacteroidota bacterium]
MNEKQSPFTRVALVKFISGHVPEVSLILIWVIVQSVVIYQFGIVTDFEAKKYINEAWNFLQNGTVSTPNYWLYSVQIFLIAAALKLKTGFLSVVVVQLLFNGLSTYIFFKFIKKSGSHSTAIILTFFLICNFPYQSFNTALQTESLFYSLTILFSCYLLQLEKLTFKKSILIFLFVVVITFTRPTGLFFIPAAAIYLFFRFFHSFSLSLKLLSVISISVGFLIFLNIVLGSGGELDFMLPFRDESIICGVPTLFHFRNIRTSENPNSIFGIFYYITHNFDQFLRLAWLRSKAFWGLFRSYYSFGHNLYLGLYFLPFYTLIVASIREWVKKNKYSFLYCCSLIIITWGSVILTCDDWHNRFYLSIVPYIYILSIPVLQKITNKLPGK